MIETIPYLSSSIYKKLSDVIVTMYKKKVKFNYQFGKYYYLLKDSKRRLIFYYFFSNT